MIVAKFNGTCPDCKLPIRIGDKLGKHNGRWAHIQCPPRQQPKHEDPMARFDLEFQQREIDQDQLAFEMKLEREAHERHESLPPGGRDTRTSHETCNAPASIRIWQKTTRRCGKVLGLLEPLHPQHAVREIGRRCPDGHFSFKCPACRVVDFAVTSAPPAEHETIVSTYCCRSCGKTVWSDEGIDGYLGEVR